MTDQVVFTLVWSSMALFHRVHCMVEFGINKCYRNGKLVIYKGVYVRRSN